MSSFFLFGFSFSDGSWPYLLEVGVAPFWLGVGPTPNPNFNCVQKFKIIVIMKYISDGGGKKTGVGPSGWGRPRAGGCLSFLELGGPFPFGVWVSPSLLLLVFSLHFSLFLQLFAFTCLMVLFSFISIFLHFWQCFILFPFWFFFVVVRVGPFFLGLALALPPSFSDCGLALPLRGGGWPFLLEVGVGPSFSGLWCGPSGWGWPFLLFGWERQRENEGKERKRERE